VKLSKIDSKSLFLLAIAFPSLIDLYYKDAKELRFRVSTLFQAGYSKAALINDVSKSRKITLDYLDFLKSLGFKEIQVLWFIDSYCDQYLDYVKKQRKLLWNDVKKVVVSDSIFIEFNNKKTDEILPYLEQVDMVMSYTEAYIEENYKWVV